VSAIALGSRYILEHAGAWQHILPYAEPILDIRVTEGATPFFLHYDHKEVGDEPFGYIVENRYTRHSLQQAAALYPNLRILENTTITACKTDSYIAEVTLSNGDILQAKLLLATDGKNSVLREQLNIPTLKSDYGQTAIVCTIKHSEPHHGMALENFRPHGPFAVLPMTQNRSSVVWSEKASLAPHYMKLPEPDFIEEIKLRAGEWLGEVKLASARFAYPLHLLHATHYTAPRLALISEAAHRMHPIAGQGLNVGMRDVALLAELVVDALRQGQDIGAANVMTAYERGRKPDTLAMLLGTDVLTHMFSNSFPGLTLARRAGLRLVEHTPPVKQLFMRYAMGLVGPQLRLTSGQPL
jgi:2-octaprenyl-6-methoxyphenol hydroxylase